MMATELRDPHLTFDPEGHAYRLDGRAILSVTQVLDLAGLSGGPWPEGSAARGTAVHLATEYDDIGDLDELSVDPAIAGYLDGWRRFVLESRYVGRLIEHRAYHPTYLYAGTIDREGYIDGSKHVLIDIKSGVEQPSHAIQLAAYAFLLDGPHRYERLAVHLRPDGSYRARTFDRMKLAGDFALFVSALNVARWKQENI